MILARKGIEIPEYCHHDPTLTNKNGFTVLYPFVSRGKLPMTNN